MADIASSSISILRFILDCINNVQLTREFENEFERCQLKLYIIQIRLSRWGEVVGLIQSNDAQAAADGGAVGSKNISSNQGRTEGNEARKTLITIKETLDMAQKVHERAELSLMKMKTGLSADGTAKQPFGEPKANLPADECSTQILDPNKLPMYMKRIGTQFEKFVQKRKTQMTKARDSVKWVMYKKNHFDDLIEDISGLASELESLLTEEEKQKLRDLSKEECNGLDKPYLREVKNVAQECDPWLSDTATEVIKSKRAASTYSITQSRNVGMITGVHRGDINGVSNGRGNTTNNYWGRKNTTHPTEHIEDELEAHELE